MCGDLQWYHIHLTPATVATLDNTTLIMKKILVTGGNKGIGLAIVKLLLRDFSDTFLLLGSRDVGRGQAAVKELLSELGKNVVTKKCKWNYQQIFSQVLTTPADCRWFTLTCAAARAWARRWRA